MTITDLVDWCGENTREVMAEKGTFNEDTAYIKADINEPSIVLDFLAAITTDRLVRLAPPNALFSVDIYVCLTRFSISPH